MINLLTAILGASSIAFAADPPPIAPVVPPSANPPEVLPPAAGSQTPFAASREQKPMPQMVECPAGPNQIECLRASMAKEKEKTDAMSKIAPILNALGSAMGGGGFEPANPGERMGAGWDSGANSGTGGYSDRASTTYAENLNPRSSRGFAPIVDPIKQWFPACTQKVGLGKCAFRNDGIWGDAAHMSRKSCHNIGAAIDVGLPLKCDTGGTVPATDPRAMEVAKCMASQTNNTFKVIFLDRVEAPGMTTSHTKGNHNHHMHIKLRSCPW